MRIPVFPIGTPIVIDAQAEQNANAITEKENVLLEKRNVVLQGGGQKYIDRTHAKGKMTAWERIEWMCDDDAPFTRGTLVNWGRGFHDGRERLAPGAGFLLFYKGPQSLGHDYCQ